LGRSAQGKSGKGQPIVLVSECIHSMSNSNDETDTMVALPTLS